MIEENEKDFSDRKDFVERILQQTYDKEGVNIKLTYGTWYRQEMVFVPETKDVPPKHNGIEVIAVQGDDIEDGLGIYPIEGKTVEEICAFDDFSMPEENDEDDEINEDLVAELLSDVSCSTENSEEEAEAGQTPDFKETTIYPAMAKRIQSLINKELDKTDEPHEVDYGYTGAKRKQTIFYSCSQDIAQLNDDGQKEVMRFKVKGAPNIDCFYAPVGNNLPFKIPYYSENVELATILMMWNKHLRKTNWRRNHTEGGALDGE